MRATLADAAYSTYGWHPLGVEAALATLDEFERHGSALLETCVATGAYFEQRLRSIEFARAPRIRVKGLAIGLEFSNGADAARLFDRCRRRGSSPA